VQLRFRFSLATFLLLPLLAGIGIKWYRGPHEFSLLEEHIQRVAESEAQNPNARYIVYRVRTGTFWAYQNLDGSLTRHGPETSFGMFGDKKVTVYRGGKRHGSFRHFAPNGMLLTEGQYVNGHEVGEWIEYEGGRISRRVRHEPIPPG
jgi:hypothetical protein